MRSRVTEAKSLVTRVVTLQPLYKLRNAQHLHWWREYNVSPGARKPSFSPQPQWPLTTCCLSIYILDVVRTSSPYISSRASQKGEVFFYARGPWIAFASYVLYSRVLSPSEHCMDYHYTSHETRLYISATIKFDVINISELFNMQRKWIKIGF